MPIFPLGQGVPAGSTTALFTIPWVPPADPYQPAESYITISEYLTSDEAVDTDNLVPGGGRAEQNATLLNKIAAASGWANRICHQTLAATVDNETASNLRVRRDGTIAVNMRFWPLLQLNSFNVGPYPSAMAPIPQPANIWPGEGRSTWIVPIGGLSLGVIFGGPTFGWRPGGRLNAVWQYVNGWPNALLTQAVTAGDTVLRLSNTLGFLPGRQYKIFDVATGNPETVTAHPTTPITTTTLPLAAPAVANHALPTAPDGVTVSGIPDEIKQAVCFLTSQLLGSKGNESIELASVGGTQSHVVASTPGFENLATACDLLDDYGRIP